MYYIDESHKQFRAEHSNLKYMLHKEKDGDILYFTIYDRSRENDKTTIKYDSAKKKVISFTDNSAQRIPLIAFNRIPAVALKTVPAVALKTVPPVALNRIPLLALNRIPA